MTDTFKIIQTAPEFSYSATGSYAFDSFKNSFKFTSKKPLTRSTVTTWNSNLNIVPTPPINPAITILRYNNNRGPSFVWSYVTWTLDNTLPNYSYSASNATELIQQEEQTASTLISVAIGTSVTQINSHAFSKCTNLTSITIPTTVTVIAERAFQGCSNLTYITIPISVTWISIYAFNDCIGLTSIIIPSSVDRITNGAFYNCTALTSITIPNSVTRIESNAFNNCIALTSIIIPNSVTTIQGGAFQNSGLSTVYITGRLPDIPSPSSAQNVYFYGTYVRTYPLPSS